MQGTRSREIQNLDFALERRIKSTQCERQCKLSISARIELLFTYPISDSDRLEWAGE